MFLTEGAAANRTRVATQNVLGRMISQMTTIRSATVVISGEEDHIGIGRCLYSQNGIRHGHHRVGCLAPTAVDAIARMVAGSISGLKAESVSVIDARTGRAMAPRSDDAMASTRNIEIKLAAEKMASERLKEALGYISGIRISVNAVVETREIVRETTSYDDPKLGVTQEAMSRVVPVGSVRGREPGIRANAGLRITTAFPIRTPSGPFERRLIRAGSERTGVRPQRPAGDRSRWLCTRDQREYRYTTFLLRGAASTTSRYRRARRR